MSGVGFDGVDLYCVWMLLNVIVLNLMVLYCIVLNLMVSGWVVGFDGVLFDCMVLNVGLNCVVLDWAVSDCMVLCFGWCWIVCC